jgi:RNA polymerase sigma-70 factor, ECF subfamily
MKSPSNPRSKDRGQKPDSDPRENPIGTGPLAEFPTEKRPKREATPFHDRDTFLRTIEPFRKEIQVHCYRMLGSLHDAEDQVQETLLRAWRSFPKFEGRSSIRNWLYRISTNVCLDAIASRKARSRILPQALGGPTEQMPEGKPSTEIAWLGPYPDFALNGVADTAPGPAARYEMRETVRLAFVAAIQHLVPRQRAVLLLRDVLGWTAIETAQTLAISLPSTTSLLQRARRTLERISSEQSFDGAEELDETQHAQVERFVKAWEAADLDGFVALLQEDATMVMPPWTLWYNGRASIRNFFAWAFDWAWETGNRNAFRLVPTRANGQVALAVYLCARGETQYHAHAIQLLGFKGEKIASLTMFDGLELFDDFALPRSLPLGSSPEATA